MLQFHILSLGAYQVNTYLIHEASSRTCCVIDPGYEPDTILEKIDELGLSLEAILLTHGHFDHVGAVKALAADTGCRVFLCEKDTAMPPMLTAGKLYYTDTYTDGDTVSLAGLEISVMETPGHTPGSVCLMVEDACFSGDTLFCGSCGRTDLPGGSWKAIQDSLHKLAALEKDYRVYPGHGESTTLAWEKMYNPYMR